MDLHESDRPEDIEVAGNALAAEGVRMSVFIPSAMLWQRKFRSALLGLARSGHELGSHGQLHDWNEMTALMSGSGERLAFLEDSRARHEDFFGRAPLSFRAPCWCGLGPAARDELARLGYRVDSSSTPGRPPFFSSFPFRLNWLFSPRAPHALRPGLLEIPTSTLLIPFCAPAVLTLRDAAHAMYAMLRLEAWAFPDRVLVFQTHAEDWNPDTRKSLDPGRLSISDFLPIASGGLGFRKFIRERNARRNTARFWKLLRELQQLELGTMLEACEEREREQALAASWTRRQRLGLFRLTTIPGSSTSR